MDKGLYEIFHVAGELVVANWSAVVPEAFMKERISKARYCWLAHSSKFEKTVTHKCARVAFSG